MWPLAAVPVVLAAVPVVVAAVLSAQASPAHAQDAQVETAEPGDPRLERLEALADELGAEDETVRRRAAEALRTLRPEMLPAVRARLSTLSRGRPPANWVDDLMHRFHRHAPSRDGEPDDLVEGALIELSRPHPRPREHGYAVKLTETLLLFRALQGMGSHQAHVAALTIVGFDGGKWRPEARNWVRREGNGVVAAALTGRAHGNADVRRWARWAVDTLGADDPGRVLPELEDPQLSDTIRAYAGLRMQSAMRVIVSYTRSERRGVRRAAREAIARYGGNAIWILRTAYRNQTGEHPPRQWGWQRVASELYAHADETRLAEARAALAAGSEARAAGDLVEMGRRYDQVLAESPEIEEAAQIAEGYAALGDEHLRAARWPEARAAYHRALRLAPEHSDAGAWRAGVGFCEAESLRARGVLDLRAYESVAETGNEVVGAAARRVVAGSASPPSRPHSAHRSPFAFAAAALLGLLGLGLLWRSSSREPRDEAHAETLHALTLDRTANAPTAADSAAAGMALSTEMAAELAAGRAHGGEVMAAEASVAETAVAETAVAATAVAAAAVAETAAAAVTGIPVAETAPLGGTATSGRTGTRPSASEPHATPGLADGRFLPGSRAHAARAGARQARERSSMPVFDLSDATLADSTLPG